MMVTTATWYIRWIYIRLSIVPVLYVWPHHLIFFITLEDSTSAVESECVVLFVTDACVLSV